MRLTASGEIVGTLEAPSILKVTRSSVCEGDPSDYCLVVSDEGDVTSDGSYPVILVTSSRPDEGPRTEGCTMYVPQLNWLSEGDVVQVHPSGFIRVLYRRASPHNAVLVTEQCNSRCLMCTQPPKTIDDSDRIGEHLRLIELMDPETRELGLTGGEPTLLGKDFLRLVAYCRQRLPRTAVHVLTNGRLFRSDVFAGELAEIRHPDLMLGIPVYSDLDVEHDHIVQARGAFEDTVLGLHQLGRHGVAVEIRVVLHALTYRRLPQLAEFIWRNLPFASHVALMGMELVGYVHKNLDLLWIDPHDYLPELEAATIYLGRRGMRVSIYNLQLCVLPPRLWPFARQSVSDWKNVFLRECGECVVRPQCAGFFQSGTKRRSTYIKPFAALPEAFSRKSNGVGA